VPESIPFLQRLREIEPKSMQGMPPIVWGTAEGFLVQDLWDNQWIDFTSGIVVANAGHAHPRVLKAIADQLCGRMAFSYTFATEIREKALAALVGIAPAGLNKAILFSSGTESTECAIALMRRHGLRIGSGKNCILSIEHAYHGRTLAARFAGGPPGQVDGLQRESAGHIQLAVPAADHSSSFVEDVSAHGVDGTSVAGILLESLPGWSTALYPAWYMSEMVQWAKDNQVLIAFDEVQTGFGRTGRWFAFEHYDIVPDLIACGKGLSGCLPAAAVIGRSEILDLAEPGEMSSTFGGNPLTAAAVAANIDVLRTEKLVERSAAMGRILERELRCIAARHAASVHSLEGRGLFFSLHLKDRDTGVAAVRACDEIVLECVRRGVLLFPTGRGFLKFVPPLMIEEEALLEGVGVIGEILDEKEI
jgi:4-aminobutyrate aminotransferase-like enzyme